MARKRAIRLTAFVLALLMPILTVTIAFGSNVPNTDNKDIETRYNNPNVNALMGAGEEPEEISVLAGATYQQKAWYEYVMYSEHAISSYRVDDNSRILFYDPYTYTNSMIMDVQFDATTTEFDTMSSYSISHTSSKTISACVESTYTTTEAVQTSGRDVTHSEVENGGKTKTIYNHSIDTATEGSVEENDIYHYASYNTASMTIGETLDIHTNTMTGTENALPKLVVAVDVGSQTTVQDTFGQQWLNDTTTHETIYSPDYKTTTKYVGFDEVEDYTTSTTDGWTELSARVTKTVGSSASTSNSWSETESTTITKVYAATHFASDGVTPLPWAIVHYQVQMPIKCCLQVKHSGEWVTLSTIYCLLTTVQGTCRAWIQNGQVYYEDWGSGEPVVATDFWSQFMTKEQLMNAYANKLYPVGGVD